MNKNLQMSANDIEACQWHMAIGQLMQLLMGLHHAAAFVVLLMELGVLCPCMENKNTNASNSTDVHMHCHFC